jgi:hypothetical protein
MPFVFLRIFHFRRFHRIARSGDQLCYVFHLFFCLSFLPSVRPSICQHETSPLPPDYFLCSFMSESFITVCWKFACFFQIGKILGTEHQNLDNFMISWYISRWWRKWKHMFTSHVILNTLRFTKQLRKMRWNERGHRWTNVIRHQEIWFVCGVI